MKIKSGTEPFQITMSLINTVSRYSEQLIMRNSWNLYIKFCSGLLERSGHLFLLNSYLEEHSSVIIFV